MDVQQQARRDAEMNAATMALPENAKRLSTLNGLLALEESEENAQVMNAALRGMGMLTDDNQANWDGKTWVEKIAWLREMKDIIQRAILSADATAVTALALSTSKAVSEAVQAELSPENAERLSTLNGLLALKESKENAQVMNAKLRGMGMLTDDNQANWDGKTWVEKIAVLRELIKLNYPQKMQND